MSICMPGMLGLSIRDAMLPVVPMFHINGWCAPYGCLIGGAKLVLPGPRLDGAGVDEMMENGQGAERAGVPTVGRTPPQHPQPQNVKILSPARDLLGGLPVTLAAEST